MKRFLPRHRLAYIVYSLLLIVAFIGLLPYYWMIASSLKTNEMMFAYPPQWIPDPVNWQAYPTAWQAQDFTRYFFNSALIAIVITVGNLLLASLAGYSLSRSRNRIKIELGMCHLVNEGGTQ